MYKKLAALAIVGLLASATAAHADTYTLNLDGCSGTCGTGPFGTITTTQNGSGNTATVTVSVTLASGVGFQGSGAGDALEFNIANVSGSLVYTGFDPASGFTPGPAPDTASTFGTFLQSITCDPSGSTGACSPPHTLDGSTLEFTVGDANGVFLSDFVGNAGGFFFAADVAGTNGNTGNVAAGGSTPPPPVPEPSSLALLGTGIVGAAGILRRRFAA